ncbi:LysR substrate-binding domain-containing protein, partial [Methylobacterium organophilum]|nr:LysR substrate-binding domain-containing protein [Methylobacterium organophilum]
GSGYGAVMIVALRLLERTTRQLRLNEAGAEFYQHCRDMLDAADAAVAIGERLMRSPRGLVRLSVPKAYGKFVVGPLMPAFLQRYPEVDVQLRISDQSPDLIEDGFDLLVQVTDNPPEGLAGKPLGPVRQLLCASPDYLQRHGEPQHPQDLLRHSCLYLGETAGDNRWHLRRGELQETVTVRGRYISNHSEARLLVALAGVWLLTGGPQLSLNLGDALMLAAALLRAVLVCLTRRLTAGREIPALALTAVQSGVVAAGCILLAVSLPGGLPALPVEPGFWFGTLYLVLFATLFAMFAQNSALGRSSATRVSLLMGSEPLFGAIIAGLWLGERLGPMGWAGGLLIMLATLCTLRVARAPVPAAKARCARMHGEMLG